MRWRGMISPVSGSLSHKYIFYSKSSSELTFSEFIELIPPV